MNALVFLALDVDCELQAQITSESVKQLRLAPGREVVALVKAPAVILMNDPKTRTSASNHMTGIVSRIHEGAVSAEVVVELTLPRVRHIAAVVTKQAVRSLELKVGLPATAAFQASSVLLATFA